MKKIYLQLTPFFPTSDRFYGPYIYDQVKAIERNSDFEVIVIKLHPFYNKVEEEEYTYQGTKVYNFKVIDLPSSTLPGLFHSINLIRLERFIKNVVKKDFDDIAFIHAHSLYPSGALAVSLGERYGVPSLVQHHGFDVFQLLNAGLLKGKLKEFNASFMRKKLLDIANRATLNIGVSQKVLQQLIKENGFIGKELYVLHNGVDTKKFFRKEKKRSTSFTIGCIGNFFEIKDHITLLKAIEKLHSEKNIENLKVRLIGSGPLIEPCKNFVKESGLESIVTFEKEVDHSLLNDFYNSLDLFVLPSYYEAFGCVYTEALQVGVPIIAVEGQGIEEVLTEDDKKVSLIPKGDYSRLAELIEFRYNHTSKVDYNFDIDIYIKKFLQHIEKLPSKADR